MKLEIVTGTDNEILRKESIPVLSAEWKKYAKIGKEMQKYVRNPDHAAIGLAAPQIGINKRFFVAGLPRHDDDMDYQIVLMINPEILEYGELDIEQYEEGCLSLPKTQLLSVPRYKYLKIKYYDEKRKEKILKLTGFAARVFQHEFDHLNGKLYVDRAK